MRFLSVPEADAEKVRKAFRGAGLHPVRACAEQEGDRVLFPIDEDGDIDVGDFQTFQLGFTGPQ